MNAAQHNLQWMAPAPMWQGASDDSTALRKPALLGFKSDQFVNELTQALASEPATLPIAEWESARLPPTGTPRLPSWKASRTPSPRTSPLPLKLFQPVHGRFYMVAASFVCQKLGLPDHALNVASEERTYFVLRRLDANGTEMAWVPDPSAPSDPTKRVWQPLQDASTHPRLAPNEELMPLFPVFMPKTATRPARRLHAGLIPTSSRDTLASAGTTSAAASSPASTSPDNDPRVFEAYGRVVEPFGAIVQATAKVNANGVANDPAIPLIEEASAFLMLDFAEILTKYVPDVLGAILGTSTPNAGASAALFTALDAAKADTHAGVTWTAAIRAAWNAKDAMNTPGAGSPYTSPSFNLFYVDTTLVPNPDDHGPPTDPRSLSLLLRAAIVAQNQPFDPPDPVIASSVVPKLDGGARFVVRCVFQRCALKRDKFPALFPPILSAPTEPFEIAPFFDTDAPARTIRIPMPIDTSPAALRKFPKSVGFILSDKLQQQICQVSDLAGVLKGQLGNCQLGIGEICCFSMPILTIIAMILMMIMAIVLNFVFWWLPFLKICFPAPLGVIQAVNKAEEA